ncbi:MAG: hypothetical protein A3B86_00545 [Candidatus Yanofskybacteria bacterium RIFCSPHIGHO2_02_FULL_38_22b]|uniref:O-antigen ligase-related domain-containing protein n=1 Tax=Candidatus Yanofskybacteria bacterium RIFCSPHIGHO2_02_FULL_38_22b TaxID=1802673 RepID=A0A1F8F5N5_9BACT|nr:MAG: hypothetical protein A2816_03720 [Candidatus Yanofskybacteria bacterium RIFCSPHIGHO2_01_FULL_39_44]OGN07569.1 MAG: hypothetical protein A3B86_00545 [Candidatus Yanofskybacteria bacterium RIFCSPHIGHO2_02_FULL_38_22b]OGN20198.1 MAG: hypothetical protein A2910_00080 [Candidatus Yanofskybacteria bacterium RIFCSPLOWO2_01_FULL_39_28]
MFKKLEKYLFYLLLFSIPFQTRKILWYEGWRFNEWTSVSIYFTDVLFFILFLFWLYNSFLSTTPKVKSKKLKIKSAIQNFKVYEYFLIIFLAVSAISITNSTNPIVSWFQWLKLLEFSVFYWYLVNYALKKFGLYNSFLAIFVGGIFQSVIAIIQFFKQSSTGLRFLGESIINSDLSGIASFYLPTGEKVIRVYGTTPHPNVLAVYLFLALFSFYFIYLYSRLHSEHQPLADSWDVKSRWDHVPLRDKVTLVFYGVLLLAFLTTFSRTIIFVWFASFCLRVIIIRLRRNYRLSFGTKDGRKRIKAILLVSFCVLVIFSSFYFNEIKVRLTISGEDQAIELRTFYAKESLKIGFNLFGVGIGNFVGWLAENKSNLPNYTYQPVHNIYLLVYSETGVLGILSFVVFLIYIIKDFILKTNLQRPYQLSFLVFFCSLLFIGFFDHLFLTIQQGSLVLWGSLGILTFISNSDII